MPITTSDDPNKDLHEAVLMASAFGEDVGRGAFYEQVDSALERGANINAHGEFGKSPLHSAALNGNAAMTGYLLDKGADPNIGRSEESPHNTPLHDAADQAVANKLMERGADIHATNQHGQTPLEAHQMQSHEQWQVAQTLANEHQRQQTLAQQAQASRRPAPSRNRGGQGHGLE